MTTETTNEAPKTGRNRRNQSYVVLELVRAVRHADISEQLRSIKVPTTNPHGLGDNEDPSAVVADRASAMLEGIAMDMWVPVGDDDCVPVRFDDLASCDRWIKNHGEDGRTYRPARVADAVEVTTKTETVRSIKPV